MNLGDGVNGPFTNSLLHVIKKSAIITNRRAKYRRYRAGIIGNAHLLW